MLRRTALNPFSVSVRPTPKRLLIAMFIEMLPIVLPALAVLAEFNRPGLLSSVARLDPGGVVLERHRQTVGRGDGEVGDRLGRLHHLIDDGVRVDGDGPGGQPDCAADGHFDRALEETWLGGAAARRLGVNLIEQSEVLEVLRRGDETARARR